MNRIKITAISYNKSLIKYFLEIFSNIIKTHNSKIIGLPCKRKKITLLRSPHVFKKSKVQYQQEKYSIFFYVKEETLNQLIFYIDSNLLHGINIKVEYIT